MIVINNTGKNDDNINLNSEKSGIMRYKLKKVAIW